MQRFEEPHGIASRSLTTPGICCKLIVAILSFWPIPLGLLLLNQDFLEIVLWLLNFGFSSSSFVLGTLDCFTSFKSFFQASVTNFLSCPNATKVPHFSMKIVLTRRAFDLLFIVAWPPTVTPGQLALVSCENSAAPSHRSAPPASQTFWTVVARYISYWQWEHILVPLVAKAQRVYYFVCLHQRSSSFLHSCTRPLQLKCFTQSGCPM